MFAFDKTTVLTGLVVFCLVMVAYLLREVMDLKGKVNTLGGHVQQMTHMRVAQPAAARQAVDQEQETTESKKGVVEEEAEEKA